MSLDLIYKNKFYVDPSLSFPFQSEKVTGTYSAVKIRESSGIDRDIDFTLKITTHRLHFTAESGYKTHLEVPMKAFTKLTLAHKGVINRKTYVVINTNLGSEFELYHPSIEEIYSQINSNFNSKLWQVEDKPSSQFDAGLGFINKQFKAEVNQTRAEVTSSTGDVQSLITKSEKLRELISYLKKNVTNESQKSELDEILSSIDAVSVVTKDEAGKNFYDELAKSVYTVTRELLNRYHGVASLVDVFYITNEKRKISLISPTDLLKACGRFQQLGLPVKLVELGKGLRVIQDINFNSDEDYKRNIAPYIDEEDGITAETLSRKTKIPLLLAISKLQMALDQGKIIIDDTIEGKRYFHNFILF